MIEIKKISDNSQISVVCSVIRAAHMAEYKSTGLVINTTNLTVEQLQQEVIDYDGICLGCIIDENIVGTMSVFHDKKPYWFSSGKDIQTIKYVAVHPEYQGKHIATELLKYIQNNFAAGNIPIMVSTDQRNKYAIKLYEKNGFKIVNVTRGRKANSNAVRLAWWPMGCPFSTSLCNMHLFQDKLKCAVKAILRY